MADELTPWEDINPLTVSAPRQEPRSKSLDTKTTFRNELTACLALTAPAGMTEEARRDWLAVAWDTLKHIPPDVMMSGARKARETCDHPSKLVPAIIAATNEPIRRRARMAEWDRPRLPEPEYPPIPHEETQRILREVREKLTVTPGNNSTISSS